MENSDDFSDTGEADLQTCKNCQLQFLMGEKGSSEALSLCSISVEKRKTAADPPHFQACCCGCGEDTSSSQHYCSDTGKRIFSFGGKIYYILYIYIIYIIYYYIYTLMKGFNSSGQCKGCAAIANSAEIKATAAPSASLTAAPSAAPSAAPTAAEEAPLVPLSEADNLSLLFANDPEAVTIKNLL